MGDLRHKVFNFPDRLAEYRTQTVDIMLMKIIVEMKLEFRLLR